MILLLAKFHLNKKYVELDEYLTCVMLKIERLLCASQNRKKEQKEQKTSKNILQK